MKLEPLHPLLGACASGLDLREPPGEALVREIEEAMDRFAVLVFRGPRLTDEQHFAFATQFGAIEEASTRVKGRNGRIANPQISDISNIAPDGSLLPADDRGRMYSLSNFLWHTDSSFKAVPAKYSLLYGHVIPPEGGETEFADMRAAWDELPPSMQQKVRELVCDHSILFSRAKLGFDEFSPEERERAAISPQRLVRRHPRTGRLSLFLSSHAGRIHGWQRPEALLLLADLTEFATQPRFVYRHAWQPGDLLMWDNRATMHRGRPYESGLYPRDLRRVTVRGDAPTLEEPA